MVQRRMTVTTRREVAEGIFVLAFESKEIARGSKPGQFVNVRAVAGVTPLLRRPFSICRVDGDHVELVFNVIGTGTRILASKRPGDDLDVLGPLGVPFRFDEGYDTAIIVGGGLGVAPFPFLTQHIQSRGKRVESFIGARTASRLWTEHLVNVHLATDDGSKGFRGTVVDDVERFLRADSVQRPKIFGCGPAKMLKGLADLAKSFEVDCEVSLEGDMACGIGICQGCPVELSGGKKKYALTCTEGPTFNCTEIIFQ